MITLKHVMRANAASCIIFGLVFFTMSTNVAVFLSADIQAPEIYLQILGAGLIFNGLHLIWASLKAQPSQLLVLYFSMGDYLWVIGSITLLALGIWITTIAGIITTLIVALMVGTFGILQMLKKKELGCG